MISLGGNWKKNVDNIFNDLRQMVMMNNNDETVESIQSRSFADQSQVAELVAKYNSLPRKPHTKQKTDNDHLKIVAASPEPIVHLSDDKPFKIQQLDESESSSEKTHDMSSSSDESIRKLTKIDTNSNESSSSESDSSPRSLASSARSSRSKIHSSLHSPDINGQFILDLLLSVGSQVNDLSEMSDCPLSTDDPNVNEKCKLLDEATTKILNILEANENPADIAAEVDKIVLDANNQFNIIRSTSPQIDYNDKFNELLKSSDDSTSDKSVDLPGVSKEFNELLTKGEESGNLENVSSEFNNLLTSLPYHTMSAAVSNFLSNELLSTIDNESKLAEASNPSFNGLKAPGDQSSNVEDVSNQSSELITPGDHSSNVEDVSNQSSELIISSDQSSNPEDISSQFNNLISNNSEGLSSQFNELLSPADQSWVILGDISNEFNSLLVSNDPNPSNDESVLFEGVRTSTKEIQPNNRMSISSEDERNQFYESLSCNELSSDPKTIKCKICVHRIANDLPQSKDVSINVEGVSNQFDDLLTTISQFTKSVTSSIDMYENKDHSLRTRLHRKRNLSINLQMAKDQVKDLHTTIGLSHHACDHLTSDQIINTTDNADNLTNDTVDVPDNLTSRQIIDTVNGADNLTSDQIINIEDNGDHLTSDTFNDTVDGPANLTDVCQGGRDPSDNALNNSSDLSTNSLQISYSAISDHGDHHLRNRLVEKTKLDDSRQFYSLVKVSDESLNRPSENEKCEDSVNNRSENEKCDESENYLNAISILQDLESHLEAPNDKSAAQSKHDSDDNKSQSSYRQALSREDLVNGLALSKEDLVNGLALSKEDLVNGDEALNFFGDELLNKDSTDSTENKGYDEVNTVKLDDNKKSSFRRIFSFRKTFRFGQKKSKTNQDLENSFHQKNPTKSKSLLRKYSLRNSFRRKANKKEQIVPKDGSHSKIPSRSKSFRSSFRRRSKSLRKSFRLGEHKKAKLDSVREASTNVDASHLSINTLGKLMRGSGRKKSSRTTQYGCEKGSTTPSSDSNTPANDSTRAPSNSTTNPDNSPSFNVPSFGDLAVSSNSFDYLPFQVENSKPKGIKRKSSFSKFLGPRKLNRSNSILAEGRYDSQNSHGKSDEKSRISQFRRACSFSTLLRPKKMNFHCDQTQN